MRQFPTRINAGVPAARFLWIKNIVVYKDNGEIATRVDPAVMTRLNSPTQPPVGQGCFGYSYRPDQSWRSAWHLSMRSR